MLAWPGLKNSNSTCSPEVLSNIKCIYVYGTEKIVLLFYVDDCIMFSLSRDKLDDVYASIQVYFKIEYYG